MNSLKADGRAVALPVELVDLIKSKLDSRWSGKLEISFKDGRIIEIEYPTKIRVARETDLSLATTEEADGSQL